MSSIFELGLAAVYSLVTGTGWPLLGMQALVAVVVFSVRAGSHVYDRYIGGIAARKLRKNDLQMMAGYHA